MKILDCIEGFGCKVNFVDENNICVGYDMAQDCCEDADWFISGREEDKAYNDNYDKLYDTAPDVEDYIFDPDYFKEVDCGQLDSGGMVRFRMVDGGGGELFLHLYNCHNGYYGHGFDFKDGDKVIQEGGL